MKRTELKKAIRGYQKQIQPDFDLVFKFLQEEFEKIKDNGVDDVFLQHVIKGWPHAGENHSGIHGHQRRMPQKSLQEAVKAFHYFEWTHFAKDTSFEHLYNEICKLFKEIDFCRGPLVCYDVAMRIGQLYGIEPEENVYLSNGAKIGAKRLLGVERLPDVIKRSRLPKPLCDEQSIYIEDILCTFKDAFLPKNSPDYRSVEDILCTTSDCHPKILGKKHKGCR